ncbi:MAG: hypothetical protein WD885_01475 [Candidatus Saccharimonadales bacterium]
MPIPKSFFHDRLILLILSINTFLALALIITALLSIDSAGPGFIKEFRSDLGLDGYKAGGVLDIVAFAIFSLVLYAFQFLAATKIYHIRRHLSLVILLLTLIIYLFSLMVINALLGLV